MLLLLLCVSVVGAGACFLLLLGRGRTPPHSPSSSPTVATPHQPSPLPPPPIIKKTRSTRFVMLTAIISTTTILQITAIHLDILIITGTIWHHQYCYDYQTHNSPPCCFQYFDQYYYQYYIVLLCLLFALFFFLLSLYYQYAGCNIVLRISLPRHPAWGEERLHPPWWNSVKGLGVRLQVSPPPMSTSSPPLLSRYFHSLFATCFFLASLQPALLRAEALTQLSQKFHLCCVWAASVARVYCAMGRPQRSLMLYRF